MFGGSLSPLGFEPSSTKQKRCAVPTVLRREAFCSIALTCSALYMCFPLSLSLCVSLSLPLLAPLLLPLLTLPRGFLVPLLLLTPPCLLSPVRHIAVRTAVNPGGGGGTTTGPDDTHPPLWTITLNQPTTSPWGSNLSAYPLWYYDDAVTFVHPIPVTSKGGKNGTFGASRPSSGFEPPDRRVDVWCVATVLPHSMPLGGGAISNRY